MPELDSLECLSLGGVDQWVRIRSRNPARPILLVVYGGPGLPLFPRIPDLGRRAGLESHFTVVYWEQRGAGKSYSPSLSTSSLTIDRYVEDLLALTEVLRTRFGRNRIGLLGESWGTILSLRALARAPAPFWGYVGVGQIVDVERGDRQSYQYTLREARRRGNQSALDALQSIGPPPFSVPEVMTQRKWLGKFGGIRRDREPMGPVGMLLEVLSTPAYSWTDVWQIATHPFFAMEHLLDELYEVNLADEIRCVERPVYVLQGRHDELTPSSLARPYFDSLEAPEKRWIRFENSAHFPFLEEPARFEEVLADIADRVSPS